MLLLYQIVLIDAQKKKKEMTPAVRAAMVQKININKVIITTMTRNRMFPHTHAQILNFWLFCKMKSYNFYIEESDCCF